MYRSKSYHYLLVALLLSPVIGLYYGLIRKSYRIKLFVLTIFGGLYGMTLNTSLGDGASHVEKLRDYSDYGVYDLLEMGLSIVKLNPMENTPSDIYIHFLYSLSGTLIYSPMLLFTLVGLVYGYFYGRAMLLVL